MKMKRVTGIGGVFFKGKDFKALREWYHRHLGIEASSWGGTAFEWREKDDPKQGGMTVFTIFPATSEYFGPGPFMVNFRVADLDGLLAALRQEGIAIAAGPQDDPAGRFAWVVDPDGNRIELWEPKRSAPEKPRKRAAARAPRKKLSTSRKAAKVKPRAKAKGKPKRTTRTKKRRV